MRMSGPALLVTKEDKKVTWTHFEMEPSAILWTRCSSEPGIWSHPGLWQHNTGLDSGRRTHRRMKILIENVYKVFVWFGNWIGQQYFVENFLFQVLLSTIKSITETVISSCSQLCPATQYCSVLLNTPQTSAPLTNNIPVVHCRVFPKRFYMPSFTCLVLFFITVPSVHPSSWINSSPLYEGSSKGLSLLMGAIDGQHTLTHISRCIDLESKVKRIDPFNFVSS